MENATLRPINDDIECERVVRWLDLPCSEDEEAAEATKLVHSAGLIRDNLLQEEI